MADGLTIVAMRRLPISGYYVFSGFRVSWVAGEPPAHGGFEALVRIRYRGEDVPAQVVPHGDLIRVRFSSAQHAVAPGQSAVLYQGERLLGGGRIVESLR